MVIVMNIGGSGQGLCEKLLDPVGPAGTEAGHIAGRQRAFLRKQASCGQLLAGRLGHAKLWPCHMSFEQDATNIPLCTLAALYATVVAIQACSAGCLLAHTVRTIRYAIC